jgi:hypothetical protein
MPVWKKIVTDVVTPEDIYKINAKNINEYLPLPAGIKESEKSYITLNFQSLLLYYINLYPGYESPLIED